MKIKNSHAIIIAAISITAMAAIYLAYQEYPSPPVMSVKSDPNPISKKDQPTIKETEALSTLKEPETLQASSLKLLSAEEIRSAMLDFSKPVPINIGKPVDNKTTTTLAPIVGKPVDSKTTMTLAPIHSLEKLKVLLNKEGNDFNKDYELDLEIQSFLIDKSISRSEKSALLWSTISKLIANQQFNAPALPYLLDTLSVMQPIELTDTLIAQINAANLPPEVNARLLSLLSDAFAMYGNPELPSLVTPDVHAFVISNGERIRDFFNQTLTAPSSPELFREVINLFPRVATPDDYLLLSTAIEQHKDLIPTRDALYARLRFTIMDGASFENHLPALLIDLEKDNYPIEDRKQLITTLMAQTRDNLLDAEANGVSDLTAPSTSKTVLIPFLEKQEPALTDTEYKTDTVITKIDYSEWFSAYSLTKTSDKAERISFTNDFLDQQTSIPKKLAIIEGAVIANDTEMLQSFKNNPNLQDSLTAALQKPDLAPEEQADLQQALTTLRQ